MAILRVTIESVVLLLLCLVLAAALGGFGMIELTIAVVVTLAYAVIRGAVLRPGATQRASR